MESEELAVLLNRGYETRGLEFKGPGPRSDRHLMARVVRAMIAMANRRDGGRVIIGVQETDGRFVATGIPAEHLATWRYDDVSASIARFTDPSVSFDLDITEHAEKQLIVLRVHEFEDIPILCKRQFHGDNNKLLLREGACYVRSRRMPASVEISSHEEMRELLDLATEKRVRAFLRLARLVGFDVAGERQPSDQEMFRRQLQGLI